MILKDDVCKLYFIFLWNKNKNILFRIKYFLLYLTDFLYHSALIYIRVNRIRYFNINVFMTMTLYCIRHAINLFCTILFCLSESSKITLIKDFIQEKNEFKVTVNNKTKKRFSAILASIIFPLRSLNMVILDDSKRPNRIVQTKGVHALYNVIHSYKYLMFRVYTSRHYGI